MFLTKLEWDSIYQKNNQKATEIDGLCHTCQIHVLQCSPHIQYFLSYQPILNKKVFGILQINCTVIFNVDSTKFWPVT